MFDFVLSTESPKPFRISIAGTAYEIPPFTDADFEAWAKQVHEADIQRALAEVPNPKERAQVLAYSPVPRPDMGKLLTELRTHAGIRHVITVCFDRAGVPAEVRNKVLATTDMAVRLRLANALANPQATAALVDQLAGNKTGTDAAEEDAQNPLHQRPGTSADVPSRGPNTPPASQQPTPASTPAA